VAVSVAAAFSIASWGLHLTQGYWAVISALLVVQTSIGGTLAASRDRLIGTALGAVVGGAAAYLRPETPWGELIALVVCAGSLTVVAARWTSFRIAPVTAVIMIVGNATHVGSLHAAGERVIEISLGSIIGVLTTLLIFPAPARHAVAARVAGTLGDLARLLGLYVERIEATDGDRVPTLPLHDKIRADLISVEAAVTEASQEKAVRFGRHVSDAIPRTLWRLRNDAVMIGRAIDHPWPETITERLRPPALAMLRAQSKTLAAYARAMLDGGNLDKPALTDEASAFRQAFDHLDQARLAEPLPFEILNQTFALAYAFDAFNRNLDDLYARLKEFVAGPEG
jgi:uncharacterized membrane protein (UPF0136 family)